MSADWKAIPLAGVAEAILTGPFGSILHQSDYAEEGIPLVNPANIVDDKIASDGIKRVGFDKAATLSAYKLRARDIVIGRRGEIGRCAVVSDEQAGWLCGTGSFVIRPGRQFDPSFLAMMIRSPACLEQLEKAASGATMPNLSNGSLGRLRVVKPPLEEQRRIVEVLGEAFAAIATATANAEKNLANARELFRSELTSVIDAGGEKWCELPLGSFCDIYQPQTIGRADMVDNGPYPVFGANGVIGKYDRFNHAEPQLLVTCRGATCGSLNVSAPNSWVTGNAMVVRPKDGALRLKLLMRIFEGAFDFAKVITGAAQPQITRKSLAPAKVRFPTEPNEQARLEARFDELQAATDPLAEVYIAKKQELAALKQSLLLHAFTGELTATMPETIAA